MAYNAFMIPFQSYLFQVYHNLCIALCLGFSGLQTDPNSKALCYVKLDNYLLTHRTITYSLYINLGNYLHLNLTFSMESQQLKK